MVLWFDVLFWCLTAGYNNLEVAEYLLQHGAEVNSQDKGGLIPLHNAASYGVSLRHILSLLSVDCNFSSSSSQTFLTFTFCAQKQFGVWQHRCFVIQWLHGCSTPFPTSRLRFRINRLKKRSSFPFSHGQLVSTWKMKWNLHYCLQTNYQRCLLGKSTAFISEKMLSNTFQTQKPSRANHTYVLFCWTVHECRILYITELLLKHCGCLIFLGRTAWDVRLEALVV